MPTRKMHLTKRPSDDLPSRYANNGEKMSTEIEFKVRMVMDGEINNKGSALENGKYDGSSLKFSFQGLTPSLSVTSKGL